MDRCNVAPIPHIPHGVIEAIHHQECEAVQLRKQSRELHRDVNDEFRTKVARYAINHGSTLAMTEFNISRSTIHDWTKRLESSIIVQGKEV